MTIVTPQAIQEPLITLVGREGQNLATTFKESINMRVNNPSLNKNIAKYHLPHVWDDLLSNALELKIISPFAIPQVSITSANTC